MPTNVLHLVDHLNEYCGMSLSTINMIISTRKQGFRGEILSGEGTAFDRAKSDNINVIAFNKFTKKKSPKNFWSIAADIDKIVKRNDIALIHAHHRWLGFIGWFVARWNGIPIVHNDHNLLYGNKYFSYWGDKVVAVSEANKKHLNEYFNISKDKIVTCYEFANLDHLKGHNIEVPEKCTHFGQMGRLAEQKGQKYLIEGFSEYLKINNNARLTIKGDGPLKKDLAEQVAELGIADHVYFEAPDNDIRAFFEKIDCFIISSIFEGSCTVAVEAAAFGVPIISTDVGGIKNYLEDGTNAILIKHASPAEILKGLKKMDEMSTPTRQKMAEKAREAIRVIFDRDRQAQTMSGVYKEVLQKNA